MSTHGTRRVLVVDDDPAIRELVRQVLIGQYTVALASNGVEALHALDVEPPAAVVLDLRMPVLDGRGFLRACRGQPRFAHIPVLVLSSEISTPDELDHIGAQAAIPKPFDVDDLCAAVTRLLDHAQPYPFVAVSPAQVVHTPAP